MNSRMDAVASTEDRALHELLLTLLGTSFLAIVAIASALLSI